MLNEQERIILKNETRIIALNVNAFQNGQGSDNKPLNNTNPIFDGVYSLATALLDSRKVAGEEYDFFNTGSFLQNMQIDLQPSLTKFDIFSTGTGANDKGLFFSGYTNLFGLNVNNTEIVNFDIIYPELMLFIKKHL